MTGTRRYDLLMLIPLWSVLLLMLKILDLYLGQGVLMKVLLFGSGTVILARKSFLHPHSPSNEMCLILESAVKIEGSQNRERYEGLRDTAGGC